MATLAARPDAADEVDRWLDELPSPVAELLLPARGRLGRPGEHFLGDDERLPPLLAYHRWLIDDLGLAADHGAGLDRDLFTAGLFHVAAIELERLILDRHPSAAIEQMLAIPLLVREASRRTSQVLPMSSPLWQAIRQVETAAVEAAITRRLPPDKSLEQWRETAGQIWAPISGSSATLIG